MGPIKSLALDLIQDTRLHNVEVQEPNLNDSKILETKTVPLVLELEEKPQTQILTKPRRMRSLPRPRKEAPPSNRWMELLGALALLIVIASLLWLVS